MHASLHTTFDIARAHSTPALRNPLQAGDAVAKGLVDEQHDEWEAVAVERAETLAAIPRDSFAKTKLALRTPTLERAAAGDLIAVQEAWSSDAVRSAVRRYVERTLG